MALSGFKFYRNTAKTWAEGVIDCVRATQIRDKLQELARINNDGYRPRDITRAIDSVIADVRGQLDKIQADYKYYKEVIEGIKLSEDDYLFLRYYVRCLPTSRRKEKITELYLLGPAERNDIFFDSEGKTTYENLYQVLILQKVLDKPLHTARELAMLERDCDVSINALKTFDGAKEYFGIVKPQKAEGIIDALLQSPDSRAVNNYNTKMTELFTQARTRVRYWDENSVRIGTGLLVLATALTVTSIVLIFTAPLAIAVFLFIAAGLAAGTGACAGAFGFFDAREKVPTWRLASNLEDEQKQIADQNRRSPQKR